MRRTNCGACDGSDLVSFLDLGESPIADAYTLTPFEKVEMYPLELAVCTDCWLVQLMEIVDHVTLFGTGYSFYSSASPPLSDYQRSYAEEVLGRFPDLAKRLTVEIGSNDGDLLRHFHEAGCEVLGVDPADGPGAVAKDRGLDIVVEPFGRSVAEEHVSQGGAGVVIANHVLAHVESVADVLDGIQYILAEDGVVYIEVQYLPDLLVNNAFDLAYHEHRNFFSLASLENAVARYGLTVVDAHLTDRQGGSLRATLQFDGEASPDVVEIRESEQWLQDVSAYRGFQGRVDRVKQRLLDIVNNQTEKLDGYGAPAKATTLLHFCGLDHEDIRHVIDTTKAKQGRYIPGTGIPIVSPEEEPVEYLGSESAPVLLLAWNYAPQIMRNHAEYTMSGGRWLVPIPSPILL